jgi:hypothetical protein
MLTLATLRPRAFPRQSPSEPQPAATQKAPFSNYGTCADLCAPGYSVTSAWNGNYYYSSVSAYHKGWLRGPSGTDFDLYLYKWNGYNRALVARADGSTYDKTIS